MTALLRELRTNQRGGVAMTAALLSPVLLGVGAMAVDLGHSRLLQAKLQAAADSAALAASQQLPDKALATAAAVALATKNAPSNYGTILKQSDIAFGIYDPATKVFTQGASPANAVKLKTARSAANGNPPPTFFARAIGATSSDIEASAAAYRASSGPAYCVIVLDPNAVSALGVSGSGTFQVPNCGVQVNSGHNKAASAGNGTEVKAKSFCVVGGYNGSFAPAPTTGCPALADPLTAVAEPSPPNGGACYWGMTPQANQTHCGPVVVTSDVTLAPGLYYFKNTVSIGAGANLSGTGVTWFFDATSALDFASNGIVNITAPSSGPYKGIALFQSRSAGVNTVMKITGGANFIVDGTIYMPRADLRLTGNSDVAVNSKTGYVIANKLSYTGSSTFTVGTWGGVQALGTYTKAALVQ